MNNQLPKVTIGLPVFNGGHFLKLMIDSILEQTYRDFELIISDNASTDSTEELCKRYAAEDDRVRYVRNQENMGAAWNYNRLIGLARGEYFKWSAHDDICAPEYLEKCVKRLDEDPSLILCHTLTDFIDETGKKVDYQFNQLSLLSPSVCERFAKFLEHNYGHNFGQCIPIWGVMRADLLKKTRLIGNYLASDRTLLGELALRGKFQLVPETLFYWRFHPGQSMKSNPDNQARAAWFDPANKGNLAVSLWRWRHLVEFLRSINRVEMQIPERLSCYMQTLKWTQWKRTFRDLLVTAIQYCTALIHRLTPSNRPGQNA